MEWRCAWCGKPHEADDPPCDNCGHGSFERAVVQQPAGGPGGDSTTLWVCPACGREHPRHTPPCSRCGNRTLERREQTVDDAELSAPGYVELLTPRYVLAFAVAIGLGVLLLLGLAGVVDLPGMDSGVPDVSDVPGDPDSYEGTSHEAVESAFLDGFNERRADEGLTEFRRTDHLDEVARYVNQRRVKATLGSGTLPTSEQIGELLDGTCGSGTGLAFVERQIGDTGRTVDDLGTALASDRLEEWGLADRASRSLTGVDVHAGPDGTLYVTQVTC